MTPLRQRTLAALLAGSFALAAFSAEASEAPDASLKSPAWLSAKALPKRPKVVPAGPSVGLGRSLGVLLLTSVLGGGALYLRSKKNKAPGLKLAQLRVVGATKLGGRAQLVLAEVNGRQILLGVTDSSVQKLGWLSANAEEEEEEEELVPALRPRQVTAGLDLTGRGLRLAREPAPAPAPKRTFRDLLASAVGNLGRPDDDSAALLIAAETQDTFTRVTPRVSSERAELPRRAGNPQMIDLEGQAKGLLARLGDPRA